MIPRIRFICSEFYNEIFSNFPTVKDWLKEKKKKYPSYKEVVSYTNEIEKIWKKEGNKILKEIEKVTGLKWKDKEIKCYVVGLCPPFSEPLTLRIYKNKNDFIDSLTHELIHQIQSQNKNKYGKWKPYLGKRYKNESITTKSHIFLSAVHKKILLNLFSESRVENQVDIYKKSQKDYFRAWQIVEKEGHENIIKKFKELTN